MPATFITLTCPTCGGKLQITSDIELFACAHCGNEHIVRRDGGTVSLQPLIEGIKLIKTSVDRNASELAIKRLKEEKAELAKKANALRHLQRELTRSIAVSAVSVLFGFLFFLASINQQNGAVCAVVSVLIVIVMGTLGYLTIQKHRRLGNEVEGIKAEYADCDQKIQKHKQIVDG